MVRRKTLPRTTLRCLVSCGVGLAGVVALLYLLSAGASAAALGLAIQQSPVTVSSRAPVPHLGYGINVRDPANLAELFAPLDLEWVKLYEQYDALPTERLPHKVLYRIQLNGPPDDLMMWGDHVESIAQAGRGLVEAYEIGNEPNQYWQWGHQVPDPDEYVAALKVAYARIKNVDPDAIVVSGGLGPVGRIQATPNGEGWPGNDGRAMDEWAYADLMFSQCVTGCFDAFGYHPFGFAYSPETDPSSVSNNFAFRGAEDLRAIMVAHNLDHKPMWATEFGWIRDPGADGLGGCKFNSEFNDNFGWMLVSELEQADYLSRAFAYADAHWPWMETMFVWNLDWNDQGWTCDDIRFFSVRFVSGEAAPAYEALAVMDKRPSSVGCRLLVEPTHATYEVDIDHPALITGTVKLTDLGGCDAITWTASLASGSSLQPTFSSTEGRLGQPLTLAIDTGAYLTQEDGTVLLYPIGAYTALLTFNTTPSSVVGNPQNASISLIVAPRSYRIYLPVALRAS